MCLCGMHEIVVLHMNNVWIEVTKCSIVYSHNMDVIFYNGLLDS